MNKYKTYTTAILISFLLLLLLVQSSGATTYTFQSWDTVGTQNDMNDLDHYYYYSWKINWNLPVNEVITSARLDIYNIWDWKYGEYDILRIYLLDSPPTLDNAITHSFTGYSSELSSRYDGQQNNNWSGQGPLVGTWSDPNGGYNGAYKVADLVFNIPVSSSTHADLTDLTNFITNNSVWGFGLDPDCHYFNDGIKFTINTEVRQVPEPSTLILLGSGMVGMVMLMRRRHKK